MWTLFLITSKRHVKYLFIYIMYHLPKNNCLNKLVCNVSLSKHERGRRRIKIWIFYQSVFKTTIFYFWKWHCLIMVIKRELLILYCTAIRSRNLNMKKKSLLTCFKHLNFVRWIFCVFRFLFYFIFFSHTSTPHDFFHVFNRLFLKILTDTIDSNFDKQLISFS